MANEVNIDTLSIQVSANAEPAAKSIGDLASAVKKFNSAVAGSKGFGDLVTLANVSKTASDNMKDAPNRLRELAGALGEISQSMKGLKIPSDLSKGFSDIGTAVKSISANVGQRLQSLASGLSALRDVGEVRISNTIGNGINSINESLANLNVNNLSRIGRFVEGVRQLEVISGLTISGSVAREMTNIAEATELISLVDFGPLREMGNAVAHLAVANDIRINNRLAENIVNLAIAAQEVQGTDWTEFERMAEGLRHLEGLGEIRIPRIRGPRANANQQGGDGIATGDANATTDLDNIRNGANEAANAVAQVRSAIAQTNDVRAFLQSNNDADILAMRLAAARDRLQQLLNVGEGELDLNAIANATEQVRRLERELENTGNTFGNFMRQFGGGFASGAGLGGLARQIQQIFSSPGNALGYGLGAGLKFVVEQVGNLASALGRVGIKAFTSGVNALKSALNSAGTAAKNFAKSVAKITFKGLTALPTLFAKNIGDRIKNVATQINGFVRSLGRIAFYRAIRTAIKEVTKAFSEGIGNLYQWSLLVDRTFSNSMDKIATSMLYLKNSLGAMVAPILNSLAPAIDLVVDKFVEGINIVNQFLAAITGSDTYVAALKVPTEWAENETEKAKKNIKELKKAILGFDELNLLTRDSRSDTQKNGKDVADYASMFENRKVESSIAEFAKRIREAFNSGEWASIGSMFADKLNGWINDTDWAGLGKKLADGLNIITSVYNAFMDEMDWINLGNKFAEGINSFMDTVDWYELGRSLTQHLNAIAEILYGFVTKLDWAGAGKNLASAVWGMFDAINWDAVGGTIGYGITGVATALQNFAENFPWVSTGKKLASGANTMFSSVSWTDVAKGLNGVIEGAFTSLNTFIDEFSWTQHGLALKDGLVEMVSGFPTTEIVNTLTGALWGILTAAMPTLQDREFTQLLGFKIADFFNNLFNPEKDFWGTAGQAANELILDLLTIGQSFVDGFKEKEAADSIKKALGKIQWREIASNTWTLIKSAFSKTGDFVDALLNMDYDVTRAQLDPDWGKMVNEFNAQSIGTKIGARISQAIMEINWGKFANDLGIGVNNLFNTIKDIFVELNRTGAVKNAVKEFIEGLPPDLPKVITDALKPVIEAIADAVWTAFTTALIRRIKYKTIEEPAINRQAMQSGDVDAITSASLRTAYVELGNRNGQGYIEGVDEAVSSKDGNGGIWGAIKNGWRALFPGAQAEEGQGMYNADFLNGMGTGSSNQNGSNSIIQQTVGPMLYGVSTTLDNYAQNVVPKKMEAIKTAFSEGWELVHQAVKTVFGDIFYGIYQTMDTASNTAIPGKLVNLNTAFVAGWETIKETVKTAYGAMFFGLYSTMDTANNSTIPDKLSTTNEVFTTNWNNIQATVKTAYGNMFYGLYTTMDNANTSAIPGKMAAMSSLFANGFSSIASGAAIAMTQVQSVVLQAMVNLESTVPSRFRNMYNDVVNMTNSLMDRVESAVNGIIDGLNNALRIHLEFDRPDWAGGGSYWWDWNANLPHIGLGRVNALAQGGILQGPTMLARDVLAGEAGREAVLPLDNNTDWMNDVADRVNERSVYAGDSAQYGEDHADSTDVSGIVNLLGMVIDRLDRIERKDMTMEVTTGQIQKAQQRTNRRAGITVIPVN